MANSGKYVVVERSVMPNGVKIQLEEWGDGFTIGAFPVLKNDGERIFVKRGETFRLTISHNKYTGYSSEDVKMDYEALKSGNKTLEDLSDHFWYGRSDMCALGMIAEYEK